MNEFKLNDSEHIALCDLLKRVGMCENGGAAKNFIAQGFVIVDGKKETRKRCKILPEQIVEFQGEKVKVVK